MWWWPVPPMPAPPPPAPPPAPPAPPAPRKSARIKCRIHGEITWERHLICKRCGRMWQRHNPAEEYHAPSDGRCKCDRKLIATKRGDPHATGRPLCPRCFAERAGLRQPEDRKVSLQLCRLIPKKKEKEG